MGIIYHSQHSASTTFHVHFSPARMLLELINIISTGTKRFHRHQSDTVITFSSTQNRSYLTHNSTSVLMQAGANPRVSTTESEDDSRVKWLCHRYVGWDTRIRIGIVHCCRAITNLCPKIRTWTDGIATDWLWIKQKDSPHDALRP